MIRLFLILFLLSNILNAENILNFNETKYTDLNKIGKNINISKSKIKYKMFGIDYNKRIDKCIIRNNKLKCNTKTKEFFIIFDILENDFNSEIYKLSYKKESKKNNKKYKTNNINNNKLMYKKPKTINTKNEKIYKNKIKILETEKKVLNKILKEQKKMLEKNKENSSDIKVDNKELENLKFKLIEKTSDHNKYRIKIEEKISRIINQYKMDNQNNKMIIEKKDIKIKTLNSKIEELEELIKIKDMTIENFQ